MEIAHRCVVAPRRHDVPRCSAILYMSVYLSAWRIWRGGPDEATALARRRSRGVLRSMRWSRGNYPGRAFHSKARPHIWCLAWIDYCDPGGSATARRDVSELTPASSRSQARADWLHRRVVQAMRSSQDLPTHHADRKPLIDEGIFDHRDHGPVGDLRKTLWPTCRQRRGQAWTTPPGRVLSTVVHTPSPDRVHRSSTDRAVKNPSRSPSLGGCPQSPPPLVILTTISLLSSSLAPSLFIVMMLSAPGPSPDRDHGSRSEVIERTRDHGTCAHGCTRVSAR